MIPLMLFLVLYLTFNALLLQNPQSVYEIPNGTVSALFLPILVHSIILPLLRLIMLLSGHMFRMLLRAVDLPMWQGKVRIILLIGKHGLHDSGHLWRWSLILDGSNIDRPDISLSRDGCREESRRFAFSWRQSLLLHIGKS